MFCWLTPQYYNLITKNNDRQVNHVNHYQSTVTKFEKWINILVVWIHWHSSPRNIKKSIKKIFVIVRLHHHNTVGLYVQSPYLIRDFISITVEVRLKKAIQLRDVIRKVYSFPPSTIKNLWNYLQIELQNYISDYSFE